MRIAAFHNANHHPFHSSLTSFVVLTIFCCCCCSLLLPSISAGIPTTNRRNDNGNEAADSVNHPPNFVDIALMAQNGTEEEQKLRHFNYTLHNNGNINDLLMNDVEDEDGGSGNEPQKADDEKERVRGTSIFLYLTAILLLILLLMLCAIDNTMYALIRHLQKRRQQQQQQQGRLEEDKNDGRPTTPTAGTAPTATTQSELPAATAAEQPYAVDSYQQQQNG